MKPEERARLTIDALLEQAGWVVCNMADANIHGAQGVAIREFPLNPGHGFADYLLYVNGKACGVIEAKKEGVPLKGVEVQSARYAQGLCVHSGLRLQLPQPGVQRGAGAQLQWAHGLEGCAGAGAEGVAGGCMTWTLACSCYFS